MAESLKTSSYFSVLNHCIAFCSGNIEAVDEALGAARASSQQGANQHLESIAAHG